MDAVTCRSCFSRFRVDPAKVRPDTKVRCAKCGHVFLAGAEADAPEAETGPEPAPLAPPEPENSAPEPPEIPAGRPFPSRPAPARRGPAHVIPLLPAGVLLAALLAGLTAAAGLPTPPRLALLFRYGLAGKPEPVMLVSYGGRASRTPEGRRFFFVEGKILNRSGRTLPQVGLVLEVFSPAGEVMGKESFACCLEPIPPGALAPFSASSALSAGRIGAWRVRIEPAHGP